MLQQLWFTVTDIGQKCISLVRHILRSDHSSEAQAESFIQLLVLKGIPLFNCKTLRYNKHSTACSAPMVSLLRAKESISQVMLASLFHGASQVTHCCHVDLLLKTSS